MNFIKYLENLTQTLVKNSRTKHIYNQFRNLNHTPKLNILLLSSKIKTSIQFAYQNITNSQSIATLYHLLKMNLTTYNYYAQAIILNANSHACMCV